MISCVVYLFGDLGFTILKDSYLIQKALEVQVGSSLEAIFVSDTFDCWKGSCWVAMALL
jgi:hypothetical protein